MGLVLYKRLHEYIAYRLVLALLASECLTMLAAILLTNPIKDNWACKAQAFLIHVGWFNSYLINTILLVTIERVSMGDGALTRLYKPLLLGVLAVSAALMALPFAYDGYGPHNTQYRDVEPFAMFCGWKSIDGKFDLGFFLNYMLPCMLIIIANVLVKIHMALRAEVDRDRDLCFIFKFTKLQTVNLFFSGINITIRLMDGWANQWSTGVKVGLYWLGYLMDLLPFFTVLLLLVVIYEPCAPQAPHLDSSDFTEFMV